MAPSSTCAAASPSSCLPTTPSRFSPSTIDGDDVYVDVTNVVNGAAVNNY